MRRRVDLAKRVALVPLAGALACAALTAIDPDVSKLVMLAALAVTVGGAVAVRRLARCAACGGFIGRFDAKHCRHCGHPFYVNSAPPSTTAGPYRTEAVPEDRDNGSAEAQLRAGLAREMTVFTKLARYRRWVLGAAALVGVGAGAWMAAGLPCGPDPTEGSQK